MSDCGVRMPDAGFQIPDVKFRISDSGVQSPGSEFPIGLRIPDSGIRNLTIVAGFSRCVAASLRALVAVSLHRCGLSPLCRCVTAGIRHEK